MNDVSRMQPAQPLRYLEQNELTLLVSADVGSNDAMKISLSQLKHEIYISMIFCNPDLLKFHYVWMSTDLIKY